MANRSRERRKAIPGYDEFRPSREDRKRTHRATRHAANQLLHTIEDIDDVPPLPEVRRNRYPDRIDETAEEPNRRERFKVWKTKFWKRRDSYQDMKASLDAEWDEIVG